MSPFTATIDERGFWVGEVGHHTDEGLKKSLCDFVKGQKTLVDFGCGDASYGKAISDKGLEVEAYDGNPVVVSQSDGFSSVLDLTKELNLNKKFDVVLSLEVGEHIPPKYESIFIDNLVKHCKTYLILSWALPGQGGTGHFNEKPNQYVIKKLNDKGFSYHPIYSQLLRNSVTTCPWFKKTILVFYKRLTHQWTEEEWKEDMKNHPHQDNHMD